MKLVESGHKGGAFRANNSSTDRSTTPGYKPTCTLFRIVSDGGMGDHRPRSLAASAHLVTCHHEQISSSHLFGQDCSCCMLILCRRRDHMTQIVGIRRQIYCWCIEKWRTNVLGSRFCTGRSDRLRVKTPEAWHKSTWLARAASLFAPPSFPRVGHFAYACIDLSVGIHPIRSWLRRQSPKRRLIVCACSDL